MFKNIVFVALLLLASNGFAATPTPGGACSPAGQTAMSPNATGYANILYCDGTNWINSPLKAGAAAVTVTCAANATGVLKMSGAALQYCPGSGSFTTLSYSVSQTNPPTVMPKGYLVMTRDAFDGNLGGLAGANAKCLSDLTTYNWNGKTDATNRSLLNSSKVFASLCVSGSVCNSMAASTRYYFATSGDASSGGSFLESTSGSVPVATPGQYWHPYNYFNGPYQIWSGREGNTNNWSNTNTGGMTTCQSYTSNSSGDTGGWGFMGNSGRSRYWAVGTETCNKQKHLICMVHP